MIHRSDHDFICSHLHSEREDVMKYHANIVRLSLITIFFILITLCLSLPAQAQDVDTLWFEDFEGDWVTDWHVDAGTWEVGEPTTGPGSSFSPENGAATILNGSYSENVDSRIIRHTTFVVPSAEANPRIRFWHWYSFSHNDHGEVQIKTSKGQWERVSPQYWKTGCGIWTHAYVDLSAYADSTVQIAFFFQSRTDGYGRTYVSSGWYIDNITVETGPVTLEFPEDWESGIDHWYADYSIWQVGAPASGPGTAYTGEQCAATLLNGNYTDDRDSRLISPSFKVPSKIDHPRLRFWHWYSFSHNDYGCVHIKTNNTGWKEISPQYWKTGCGIWTRAFIDLSAYADSTVQVAFYLHTDPDGYGRVYESSGWYIDDIEIETGLRILRNPEDWESGFDDWYTDFSIWQIGSPASGPDSAYNGDQCAATILNGNYTDDRDSRLISPFLVVPKANENPALRFWHWYSFSHNDYGYVQIRTEKNAWTTLSNTYTGTSGNVWSYTYFSLADYADSTVQFAFNLHTDPDGYGRVYVSSGWYVDDVLIVGYTYPSLYVETNALDFGKVIKDHTADKEVDITNDGTDVMHVGPIYMAGDDPDNFSTDTTSFMLDPGTRKTLQIDFTPDAFRLFNARLKIYGDGGNTSIDLSGTGVEDTTTSVYVTESALPKQFQLKQNYPNPFNPETTIRFELPSPEKVTITIYNNRGQVVSELINHAYPAGYHSVTFDAVRFSSGLYYYKIQAGQYTDTRKMLLMK